MTDRKFTGLIKKVFAESLPVNGTGFSGKLLSVIVLLIILAVSLAL